MDIKSNIGKRIKELRIKKKLSQEKLSELADISQNTLSSIECGDNFISAESLERIMEALGVTADELFNFHHQKTESELLNEINQMLSQNPEKIADTYKILRALIV